VPARVVRASAGLAHHAEMLTRGQDAGEQRSRGET
jgi:hypothetical protein